ncbi:type I toxin-antitoxin system Ibs family toxin [Salmonella bongori]|nr:type I toxin-antitoxin system Ibs family toxin [Salmonella bongori]EHU5137796.1 type I toxin-antitoxin system Ibs family toxin [Salmonella bongori]EIL5513649.1 type I toxin-antitoxin system Ibs family toxin [Salmonella bongori]EIZ4351226.1 type I toxin-antitoxin system Ibs family toxin [Salmonella bongori serovar 48:z81:-]EJX9719164.1 type I toxin-antitoxin system Ibs family toxin [Salmonella bongori]EJX9724695.1 type I toxin-antitoxin system Ibs family toxin [Salmonella bongori]
MMKLVIILVIRLVISFQAY